MKLNKEYNIINTRSTHEKEFIIYTAFCSCDAFCTGSDYSDADIKSARAPGQIRDEIT